MRHTFLAHFADSFFTLFILHSQLKSIEQQDVRVERSRYGTLRLTASKQSAQVDVPKFYFPLGKPCTSLEIEKKIQKVRSEYDKLPGKCVMSKNDMLRITKACGLPSAWKEPLRLAFVANRNKKTTGSPVTEEGNEFTSIACDEFIEFWRRILSTHFDDASRFVALLSKGERSHLLPDDFVPMIQDIVDCHPGLNFLREATEFHSRYVHTVT